MTTNEKGRRGSAPKATGPVIDWALYYRDFFPKLFPICRAVSDSDCIQHGECSSPGKTPLVKWRELGSVARSKLRQWFGEKWPEANIGIATGPENDLAVIDVDEDVTDEELAKLLETDVELFTETAVQRTAKGRHYLYSYPDEGVRNSVRKYADVVDVRGEGGFIVVAPSVHATEKRYAWRKDRRPDQVQLQPFPEELANRLNSDSEEADTVNDLDRDIIPEGQRNDTLMRIASAMRRHGATEQSVWRALQIENKERCEPPLARAEVRRIARNVSKYGPAEFLADTEVAPPPQLHPAALYGPAGDFVRAVEPASESDETAILVQFLVMFGNAVGRGPYWLAERDHHFTNEYAILVGQTSKARKGTSLGWAKDAIGLSDDNWRRERLQSGLSSGQGLVFAVRDAIPSLREDGQEIPGVEDKRLMVIETEFASVLRFSRMDASILSNVLRQAWDGTPLGSLTKNDLTRCQEPHVSVIGHITLGELKSHLDSNMILGGTANRFGWFYVRRSKILPEGGQPDERALNQVIHDVGDALGFARNIAETVFTPKARTLWRKIYRDLESMQAPGILDPILGRSSAHLRRFAMLYALLDCRSKVDTYHLKAAAALWDYQLESCRYIFGSNVLGKDEERILSALQAEEEHSITRSDASRILGGHKKPAEISRIRDSLEVAGLIRVRSAKGESGRKSECWQLVEKKERDAARAFSPLGKHLGDGSPVESRKLKPRHRNTSSSVIFDGEEIPLD